MNFPLDPSMNASGKKKKKKMEQDSGETSATDGYSFPLPSPIRIPVASSSQKHLKREGDVRVNNTKKNNEIQQAEGTFLPSSLLMESSPKKGHISFRTSSSSPSDNIPRSIIGGSNTGISTRRAPISDISIEPDAYPGESQIINTPKNSTTQMILSTSLKRHFLFADLGQKELLEMVGAMTQTCFPIHRNIIQQGKSGNRFYVLEKGTCDILLNDNVVGTYKEGDSFGELALMYNSPRAVTIRSTSSDCKVWSVDRTTFRRILATTAASNQVDLVDFLSKVPLLEPLSPIQLQKVAAALKLKTFSPGSYVIRQADEGDTFYLILSGTVECTSTNNVTGEQKSLMTLSQGDYFGEMALMLNEPRQANVIARGDVPLQCYTLNREQFTKLLGPLTEVLDRQMRIRVLKSVPLLKALSDNELDLLAHELHVVSFGDKQPIITEGEAGTIFYMISEGHVSVQKSGVEVMQLHPGDFFGERALLKNEPRAADCISIGRVECLTLDRYAFEKILGKLEHIMQREMIRQQAMQEVAFTTRRESSKNILEAQTTHLKRKSSDNVISMRELERFGTIGTGTFGRVLMVHHKRTDQTMALKCMQKSTIVGAHQERNVIHEKNIVAECDHPFILKLYETYSDANQLYMLFELVQGGELWSLLYEKSHLLSKGPYGSFDIATSRFYSANIVLIFEYLAKLGVAYRDLKPENILVDDMGYLKLVDFGFAKHIPFFKSGTLQQKSYTLCGTPEYLAPEIVLSKGHNRSVDFWAMGCLIYELLVGNTPFQDDDQPKIFEKIINVRSHLNFPPQFDPIAKDLIVKLLHPNPALRLGSLVNGVSEIKNHPWFSTVNFDWDSMLNKRLKAPFVPLIKDKHDTSNFDPYPEDAQIIPYKGPDYFIDF